MICGAAFLLVLIKLTWRVAYRYNMHLLFIVMNTINDRVIFDKKLTVILIGISANAPDTSAFGKLLQAENLVFQRGNHFFGCIWFCQINSDIRKDFV